MSSATIERKTSHLAAARHLERPTLDAILVGASLDYAERTEGSDPLTASGMRLAAERALEDYSTRHLDIRLAIDSADLQLKSGRETAQALTRLTNAVSSYTAAAEKLETILEKLRLDVVETLNRYHAEA